MRNNSFRKTFYLGLFFLLILSGIVVIIGVNAYRAFSPNDKKPIIGNVVVIYEKPEDSLVDNNINFEEPIVKDTFNSIEKVKMSVISPVVTKKKDTTNKLDTIR